MKLEDVLGPAVPVVYFGMMAVEAFRPARKFPRIPFWRLTSLAFVAMLAGLGAVAPLLLDPAWLRAHSLMDLSRLGFWPGAATGFLAATLASYAFHRACHRSPALWRAVHQLHHSPGRVDIAGSVFFHPLEGLLGPLLGIAVTAFLLGLDPRTAALVSFAMIFCSTFQHWNVRTPRWLGYLIQRPEAHCIHHEHGVHAWNYGLPLWDLAFGTFRNPESWEGRAGFDQPGARRVGAMLLFTDVSRPPQKA
ncbi:MAG TPA: sterol desaturase family protein [Myxococcales bacterium]|nr:sterol desaturase family protein [Myxococcales bacterium]